jgi:hypothetical protein
MSLDTNMMRCLDLELSTEIDLSLGRLKRIRQRMTRRLALSNLIKLEEILSISRELSERIKFALQQPALIRSLLEIAKA